MGYIRKTIGGYYAIGIKCKDLEREPHIEQDGGVWKLFSRAKDAFAAIIDKTSGKGTWENNPYVWKYSFKLVD